MFKKRAVVFRLLLSADVLVKRFQDTMEGEKTSIFQKIKDKGSTEEAPQTQS